MLDRLLLNSTASNPAWDISYAVYEGDAPWVIVEGQEPGGNDVVFSSDGTKMYIVGQNNDTVYQYTLSTAWAISTASYSGKSLSITTQETLAEGVAFSSDGTKMYIVGTNSDTVYQYTLSTAWDISTGSYASKSVSVSSQSSAPRDVLFSSDGTKMYIIALSIWQYTLTTAWDVSTASYASKSFSFSSQDATPIGACFSDDGEKLYIGGNTNDTIYQYSLTTAWDVSTTSYDSKSYGVTARETAPGGIAFSADGTKLFVQGSNSDAVYEHTLSTAWDISTASFATSGSKWVSVTSQDGIPTGLDFSSDGTKMFVMGATNSRVYQYALSTAWDVGTASYSKQSASYSTKDNDIADVTFSSDGTKMYILGNQYDTVFQYTLSTAWDIGTTTYANKSFSCATQEAGCSGLSFSSDGTKMYVVGTGNDTVYQYTLSTAWDVSTASYASKSFSVLSQEETPSAVTFSSDGTTMYVVGYTNDTVYQYTLSTAWDVSTASYASKSFSVLRHEKQPQGIRFSSSGDKFYVVGRDRDSVIQYTI